MLRVCAYRGEVIKTVVEKSASLRRHQGIWVFGSSGDSYPPCFPGFREVMIPKRKTVGGVFRDNELVHPGTMQQCVVYKAMGFFSLNKNPSAQVWETPQGDHRHFRGNQVEQRPGDYLTNYSI